MAFTAQCNGGGKTHETSTDHDYPERANLLRVGLGRKICHVSVQEAVR
jgi:hypothetical protein